MDNNSKYTFIYFQYNCLCRLLTVKNNISFILRIRFYYKILNYFIQVGNKNKTEIIIKDKNY